MKDIAPYEQEKYEVLWTKNSEFDLELIVEYIKNDSLDVAYKIFFEIKKQCNDLYFFPHRHRIVPELQQIGISKYREIIHKRWRIIYKIDSKRVYVVLVADSNRNLEDILFQRLIQ